jgi:hypothetical protein
MTHTPVYTIDRINCLWTGISNLLNIYYANLCKEMQSCYTKNFYYTDYHVKIVKYFLTNVGKTNGRHLNLRWTDDKWWQKLTWPLARRAKNDKVTRVDNSTNNVMILLFTKNFYYTDYHVKIVKYFLTNVGKTNGRHLNLVSWRYCIFQMKILVICSFWLYIVLKRRIITVCVIRRYLNLKWISISNLTIFICDMWQKYLGDTRATIQKWKVAIT